LNNEKSLELENGNFVGMNQNGAIVTFQNTFEHETRWTFIRLEENPIFKIFTNGSKLTLKGYYGAYLSYEDGRIRAVSTCTNTSEFIIEKDRDYPYYRFRTGTGKSVMFGNTEWLFVTQHKLGYSFEIGSTGKYLGITEEGVFHVYDHFFSVRETIFHPNILGSV
jgi:hypothetical protein